MGTTPLYTYMLQVFPQRCGGLDPAAYQIYVLLAHRLLLRPLSFSMRSG